MAENNGTITIPAFDLKSWLTGFVLGLSGKPLPLCKRQPVAYLYNGIRLPALPEWDREMYPYAYMAGMWSIQVDGTYSYIYAELTISSVPLSYDTLLPNYKRLHAKETASVKTYSASNEDNNGNIISGWNELVDLNTEIAAGSSKVFSGSPGYFWCNTDLYYYEDDTVYLAASEPIPVYE